MLEFFKKVRDGFINVAFAALTSIVLSIPVQTIFLKTNDTVITKQDILIAYAFIWGVFLSSLIVAFVMSVLISDFKDGK